MGIFSDLFSDPFLNLFSKDERVEALRTWDIYLRSAMSRYREDVSGQRIVIKNERLEGPREIAWIIEVGLEDLGAQVIRSSDEPYDWELRIERYSHTDALYTLLNASGNMVNVGTIHHTQAAAKAIEILAEHCRSYKSST